MAKWVFLAFVVALVIAGYRASQPDASGWARAMPTLVIVAGGGTGIVMALRSGLRRRKALADIAVRLGLTFENYRPVLLDSGIGVLKQFVHCRPKDELPFLMRGVRVGFANVISGTDGAATFFMFDYTTSRSRGGPDYHGFFGCFQTPGGELPDFEIVPRLWGNAPRWAKLAIETSPRRQELTVDVDDVATEYQIYAVQEAPARAYLDDEILSFFADPGQTGWWVEASGEWMAITRLAPTGKMSRIGDPMVPDRFPREARHSYHRGYIAPQYVPAFYDTVQHMFRLLTKT